MELFGVITNIVDEPRTMPASRLWHRSRTAPSKNVWRPASPDIGVKRARSRRKSRPYCQTQNDVYGSVVLAATHASSITDWSVKGNMEMFALLEVLGKQAIGLFDKPDAGPGNCAPPFRFTPSPASMCWAACDRLAKVLPFWSGRSSGMVAKTGRSPCTGVICDHAWNAKLGHLRLPIRWR